MKSKPQSPAPKQKTVYDIKSLVKLKSLILFPDIGSFNKMEDDEFHWPEFVSKGHSIVSKYEDDRNKETEELMKNIKKDEKGLGRPEWKYNLDYFLEQNKQIFNRNERNALKVENAAALPK